MASFFGMYEHSLDTKGRVILPAKFRAPFERGAYLSEYLDRCLALWTPDEFEDQMAQMRSSSGLGPRERNVARVWASASHDVEMDKQGRIVIPGRLREFARLDGDVLVNGAINRVEIWNPGLWEEKVRPSEQHLTEEERDDGT